MTLLVIIKQQISIVVKVGIVALYSFSQTLASVIIILKFYENQAQIE